jgi:DNA modification methylase
MIKAHQVGQNVYDQINMAANPLLGRIAKSLPPDITKRFDVDGSSHLLVTADSENVLPMIPEKSVNLIVTDPPYNRGLNYGVASDRKKPGDYYDWCRRWLAQCSRVLSEDGSFYLISYPEINARLLPFIEDDLKLTFRRWITWHYPTNIGHSKRNFTRSQRTILFFTKGDDYVFNRQEMIQHYKNPEVGKIARRIKAGIAGRASYDVLNFLDLLELNQGIEIKGMADVLNINLLKNVSPDRFNKQHPCQLPLPLLNLLVRVSTSNDAVVLDPFAGTFTLGTVAAQLGRNSVGIEINPAYVKLGLKRLKNCQLTLETKN